MSKVKKWLLAAAACYVVVAVGIDHFLLGIGLQHTLTDPLNFIGSGIVGLVFILFSKGRR